MKKIVIVSVVFLFCLTAIAQKLPKGIYANIQTNKGDILLELYYKKVPLTVANFVALAEGKLQYDTINIKEPFYDGVIFHRVIDDFMIQTGDPMGTGSGDPGYKFYDEFDNTLRHDTAGVLSMANAGPNTNGSQFFITHKETPWLNDKHSVFGKVYSGQDVVDAIEKGDTMHHVEIIKKGWKATFFNAKKVFKKTMAKKEEELEHAKKAQQEEFNQLMEEKYPDAKTSPSGLMYVIQQEGSGKKAEAGKTVKVHYTGKLQDGTKFDSSLDRGAPIEFALGKGMVIPGWEEGIALMKEGGKATLIIPPKLGYGSMAKGPIPANSTLFFDVELIEVK